MKCLAAIAVLLWWPLAASASERFAIVVGNNSGSASRAKLWFAERDATHFASVLREVGDFPADHVVLLLGGSAGALRQAFAATEQRIQRLPRAAAQPAGAERAVLLFYFSGHASEDGLELSGDRVGYDDLRAMLVQSSAGVRVALVDACDSGVLTQPKGGHPSAAVDFPLPGDNRVEGVAFIASTSPGEAAQESALLQGSFFTSHLEAALRGAGDFDGDGRVTLTEAFRYTSEHTVSATAHTRAGAQHPTYAMRMSGSGDIVLSDLRHADTVLVLPPAIGAEYVLEDASGLVAEVPGSPAPVRLALAPGRYEVERRSAVGQQSVAVVLTEGQSVPLPDMRSLPFGPGEGKGGLHDYELVGGMSFTSGAMLHEGIDWGGQIGVSRRLGPIRVRLSLDYGQSSVSDAGLNYDLITSGGDAAVLYPFFPDDGFRLDVGAQAGAAWAAQVVSRGPTLGALDLMGAGVVSMSYPVGVVRLGTDLTAGVQRLVVDGAPSARFTAGALLTAGIGL